MIAVFVLLTTLLSVINVINFALVAEDADRVTALIAEGGGSFRDRPTEGAENTAPGRFEAMGPESPETPFSARYFTVRFKKSGDVQVVEFRISAFTEEEAISLAEKLKNEKTGWVDTTYRFRVYEKGGSVFVTVVDQGRELNPSYRILVISIIGEIAGLAVCFLFLWFVSRGIVRPIEEADRKQKKFLREAEAAFKIPLTVIGADVEIIEKESGPTDRTGSIRRQVKKMTEITKRLGDMSVIEGEGTARFDLSAAVRRACVDATVKYPARGISPKTEIEDGITVAANPDALGRVAEQLLDNAMKFAVSYVSVSLKRDGDRVKLKVKNDADLPDGPAESAFDRFVKLGNAEGTAGDGLGLSFVRDAVREAGGRVGAEVKDGEFTVRVSL